MDYAQMGLALVVGIIVGGIFAYMRLPVPTPEKIEGVLGVIGVFIGMMLIRQFMH